MPWGFLFCFLFVGFFVGLLWIFVKRVFYRFDFLLFVPVNCLKNDLCEKGKLALVSDVLILCLCFLYPCRFFLKRGEKIGDSLGVNVDEKTVSGTEWLLWTDCYRFFQVFIHSFLFPVVFL